MYFSKYLKLKDLELYEQLSGQRNLFERIQDRFFPDQVRKDGKWVPKTNSGSAPTVMPNATVVDPAKPSNVPPPIPSGVASSPSGVASPPSGVSSVYLDKFKELFRAVMDKEFEPNKDNKKNEGYPQMWKDLESSLLEKFKDNFLKYNGKEFTAYGKWNKSKLFGEKGRIENHLKLKKIVDRGVKGNDSQPVDTGYNTDAYDQMVKKGLIKPGEFDLPMESRRYAELNSLTFESWFKRRISGSGECLKKEMASFTIPDSFVITIPAGDSVEKAIAIDMLFEKNPKTIDKDNGMVMNQGSRFIAKLPNKDLYFVYNGLRGLSDELITKEEAYKLSDKFNILDDIWWKKANIYDEKGNTI